MTSTINMLILAFLLQDNEILNYTEEPQQTEINNLAPLNHYTTGEPPKRFIYDPIESMICWVNPQNPLFQTPEYQELLNAKPIFTYIGIEVYSA